MSWNRSARPLCLGVPNGTPELSRRNLTDSAIPFGHCSTDFGFFRCTQRHIEHDKLSEILDFSEFQ